jgi:hypothetical protein
MVTLGQLLKERVEKEEGVLVRDTVAVLLMVKVDEEVTDWEAVVVEEAAGVPAVVGVAGPGVCPLATQARQASRARGRARGGAAAPRGREPTPSCRACCCCQGQLLGAAGAASQALLRRQRPSRAPRHSSSARRRPTGPPKGREKAPPPEAGGGSSCSWPARADRAALCAAMGERMGWGWEDSQDRGASALPTSRARARPQCMGAGSAGGVGTQGEQLGKKLLPLAGSD